MKDQNDKRAKDPFDNFDDDGKIVDSEDQVLDRQGPPTLGHYDDSHSGRVPQFRTQDAAGEQYKLHFQYAATTSSHQKQPSQHIFQTSNLVAGGQLPLSQADLGSSQISDMSSYRPGDYKRHCDKELHMAIDDLDCPDESSMTISQLSQSAWQGKSTRSFLSGLTSNHHGDGGTEGIPSGRLCHSPTGAEIQIDLTAGSRTISRHDLNNFNASLGSVEDYSGRMRPLQIKEKGSPAFARDTNSVSDDNLTVSVTDDDMNKSSYRGGIHHPIKIHDKKSPSASGRDFPGGLQFVRNQNRTFADSVIDHHQSHQMAASSLSKNVSSPTAVKSAAQLSYLDMNHVGDSGNEVSGHQFSLPNRSGPKTRSTPFDDILCRDDDIDVHDRRRLSDLSEVDYLAQTQISNNLMTAAIKSRIFPTVSAPSIENDKFADSNITAPSDIGLTRRTNNTKNLFHRMEDVESLAISPQKDDDSNGESGSWMKNMLARGDRTTDSNMNQLSDRDNTRLSSNPGNSSNPLSQLKAKIREQNKAKKGAPLTNTRQNTIPGVAVNTFGQDLSKEDLEVNSLVSNHQEEIDRLKSDVRTLEDQLTQMRHGKSQVESQSEQLRRQLVDLQAQTRRNATVNQSGGGSELIRARALEAARQEIKELRQANEEVKMDFEKVVEGRKEIEEKLTIEKAQLAEKYQVLVLQVEKQKIFVGAHKRDMEQAHADLEKVKVECESRIVEIERARDAAIGELKGKIAALESTMSQYEVEYNLKADEVDSMAQKVALSDTLVKEADKRCLELKIELKRFREKSQELESELDQIRQRNVETHNLKAQSTLNKVQADAKNFDQEIKKIKELHSQQMATVKAENQKLKLQSSDAAQRSAALEEQIQEIQKCNESGQKSTQSEILNQLIETFGATDPEQVLGKVLEMQETSRLIEDELTKMQEVVQAKQTEFDAFRYESQAKITQLETQLRQATAVQKAPEENSQPAISNFTRNLLQNKDNEIERQKTQLDQLTDKTWNIEQELKLAKGNLYRFEQERSEIEDEMSALRQAKEKAEANVNELKDKLREELLKNQQQAKTQAIDNSIRSNQRERYQDDTIDRAKYEELISAVMGLELAHDPLSDMNLSLQQSFMDELEQATGHLDEQRRLVQAKVETQALEIRTLTQRCDELKQKKDEILQIAQRDNQTAQEIKLELEAYVIDNSRLKQEIDELGRKLEDTTPKDALKPVVVAENREIGLSHDQFMEIFDAIAKKQDCSFHHNQGFVSKLTQRIEALKAGFARDYELQKEALIQSFSQEFAVTQQKQSKAVQKDDQNELQGSLAGFCNFTNDFLRSTSSVQGIPKKQVQQLGALQLHKIPSITEMARTEGPTGLASARSNASAAFSATHDDLASLQQLLNKCEIELEAKNHMVGTRDAQILEFKRTIEQLQDQVSQLNRQASADVSAQKDEMRAELEALKEKVLNELKQKSAELEKEADDLEHERINLEKLLIEKEAEFGIHIQEVSDAHEKHIKEVSDQHEKHLSELNEAHTKQMDVLQMTHNEQISMLETELQTKSEIVTQLEADLERKQEVVAQMESEMEHKQEREIELEAAIQLKQEAIDTLERKVDSQARIQSMPTPQKTTQAAQISSQSKLTADLQRSQTQLKEKEREVKRLKEEIERLNKSHQDKQEQQSKEQSQAREDLTTEFKEKFDDLQAKLKREKERAVEKAVEKVRSDLRNQLDSVKNELAKAKSDMIREKKRLVMEHETAIEEKQKESELEKEAEVKSVKERTEKLWKKKLEDREIVLEQRLNELDTEVSQIREKHQDDLRRERERTEIRIRENIRAEVKNELVEDMAAEFKVEMQRAQQIHKNEIQQLTRQLDEASRTDRSLMMPRTMEDAAMQVSGVNLTTGNLLGNSVRQSQRLLERNKSPTSPHPSGVNPMNSTGTCMCGNTARKSMGTEEHENYIQQLKEQFEGELERQQAIFKNQIQSEMERQQVIQSHNLANNTVAATKTLQELVILECEKILQFIFFKSSANMQMEELNQRRNEINDLIKTTIERNSKLPNGTPNRQLKTSFDQCKKKLSEVLAALKVQLEGRYKHKLDSVMQTMNQAEVDQTPRQGDQRNNMARISTTNLISESIDALTKLLPLGLTTLNKNNETSVVTTRSPTHFVHQESIRRVDGRQQSQQQSPAVKQSLHSDRFKMLQSKEFAIGYLEAHQQQQIKDNGYTSDIKKYTELMDDEVIRGSVQTDHDDMHRGKALLKRLAPQEVNSNGKVVVEVEKVVRDLSMLHKTIKMAKFYRILVGQSSTDTNNQSIDIDRFNEGDGNYLDGYDQERVVQNYRDLLNDFFKLIVRLNNSTEQLTHQSEIYKLKLLNVDLKTQIRDYKQEAAGMVTRQRVEQILNYFQRQRQLSQPTKEALEALEQINFQISKMQFKINQLSDLFIVGGDVNVNVKEVQRRCEEFSIQGGEFMESTLNFGRHGMIIRDDAGQGNKHINAEMLSPDETVQLLANVVQKMAVNQTQQMIVEQQQQYSNNPNMSILSNEDILKQALQICQLNKHNVTMPPLQMNQTQSTVKTTTTMSGLPPQIRTKRSNMTTAHPGPTVNPGPMAIKLPDQVGYKFGGRSRSVQNAQQAAAVQQQQHPANINQQPFEIPQPYSSNQQQYKKQAFAQQRPSVFQTVEPQASTSPNPAAFKNLPQSRQRSLSKRNQQSSTIEHNQYRNQIVGRSTTTQLSAMSQQQHGLHKQNPSAMSTVVNDRYTTATSQTNRPNGIAGQQMLRGRPKNILGSISQKSGLSSYEASGQQRRPRNNNFMGAGPFSNQGAANEDNETVPGEFDADDMIVMDGVTIDQTDQGTIDNHYIMAEPNDNETLQEEDMHSEAEDLPYGEEESTSQFLHRVNNQGETDQLSNAQSNVNKLFEQLKTKFATVQHD